MSTLARDRIRLAIDIGEESALADKFTSETPMIWRGTDVQFELALYDRGVLLDLSTLQQLRIVVKPADNRTGTAVMDKTISSGFNNALTQQQWDADTDQHAIIPFTNAETNIATNADTKDYWLVVTALTLSGLKVTCGSSVLTIVEDGDGDGSTPPAGDPLYYTATQSDARYVFKFGDTMTGLLKWSGTSHLGLQLINLTTAQRDAIASPLAGSLIFNTTVDRAQVRTSSAWVEHVNRAGDTMTGLLTVPSLAIGSLAGVLKASAGIVSGSATTADLPEGTNLYYTQARFDTAFAAKTTTNLAEGTNLYYTQARFDTAFAAKTTTNLAEGTNLYYTQARFDTAFAAKTTTNLAEGTNLYYTDARARAAMPLTTRGDLMTRDASALVRLGIGGAAKYLRSDGTDPSWQTITTSDITEGTNLFFTNTRVDDRITSTWRALPNGLASLGADSKIPTSQLPALAITTPYVVASQAAMLALTAETGDVAIRTDLNKSFILDGDPTVLANWKELLTPPNAVLSVNGHTGAVTLTTSDIAEGTNQYFTDARARSAVATIAVGILKSNGSSLSVVNGATNRVTFWSDANTLSSDANLTWAAAVLTVGGSGSFSLPDGNNQSPKLILLNTTSGTAAGSSLYIGNSASSFNFSITKWDSAHSTKASQVDINNVNNANLNFLTNNTLWWSVTGAGIFQSNGAQTIQTSTGQLDIKTGAAAGNIVLIPHTTGQVQLTSAKANDGVLLVTNTDLVNGFGIRIQAGGTASSRSAIEIDDATGAVLWKVLTTTGSVGVLQATGAQTITNTTGILTVTGTGGLTLSTAANTNGQFNVGTGTIAVTASCMAIGDTPSPDRKFYVYKDGVSTTDNYGAIISNQSTSVTASVNRYGLYLSSGGSLGATSTNYALYITNTSGGTTNWAIYNNTAANVYLGSGNTLIGTAGTPSSTLHVAGGTITSSGIGLIMTSTDSVASSRYYRITNTSGDFLWGVQGSSVSDLLINAVAYSGCIGTIGAKSLHLGTNNTVRVTIDSAGLCGFGGQALPSYTVDITGTLRATSTVNFLAAIGANALVTTDLTENLQGLGGTSNQFVKHSGVSWAAFDLFGTINTFTTEQIVQRDNLGTSASFGVSLLNTTAAAAGAQQVSPAFHLRGSGWKTNATAASQTIDLGHYLLPVQGAASPSGIISWDVSIAGGAYSTVAYFTFNGDTDINTFRVDRGSVQTILASFNGSSYGYTGTVSNHAFKVITNNAIVATFSAAGVLNIPNLTASKFVKTNGAKDLISGDVDWTDIINKPSAFAPSSHTHPAIDIVSGQVGLVRGGTAADLSGASEYSLTYILSGAFTTLGPNTSTTRKYLGMTGTGSAGAVPTWTSPAASEITGAANLTVGSGVSITSGSGTGATLQALTLAIDQAFTPSWTGLHTHYFDALGTGQSDNKGVLLTNTTFAAAGAQQISPALRFHGAGWKTTATAASQTVDLRQYLSPIQGATQPAGLFTWEASINGGSYTTVGFLFFDTATDWNYLRIDRGSMKTILASYNGSNYGYTGTVSNHDFKIITNNAVVATFSAAGLTTIGALTSTGTVNVNASVGALAIGYTDTSGNLQGLAWARGRIAIGGFANWTGLAIGAANTALKSDGTDAAWGNISYTLSSQFTDVGNVGSGEDNLMTYTVPAGQLAVNGERLKIRMSFGVANNANSKTIKVYLLGVLVYTLINPSANQQLIFNGEVARTDSTHFDVNFSVTGSNTLAFASVSNETATLANALVVKATGEAVADNDIVQGTMSVEYWPA